MFRDISTLNAGSEETLPASDDLVLAAFDATSISGQMWLEYSVFDAAHVNMRKGRIMVTYSAAVPTGDLPYDHPYTDDIGDTSDITFHATIDGSNLVEIKFSNSTLVDWYVAYELNQADQ